MSSAQTVVVATQSNYIPWKGYFDLIRQSDRFILLDCVQFTRRDWRNRNKIKTPKGLSWLTIPMAVKGRYQQAIDETCISTRDWSEKHLRAIESNYARSAAFAEEMPWLTEQMRAVVNLDLLSDVNRHLLAAICQRIGIDTPLEQCEDIIPRQQLVDMEPSRRLLELCLSCDATHYLSGAAAKDYLDVDLFASNGVEVIWMDYSGYPLYKQRWGEFEHGVSIIDLLFNVGSANALKYIQRPDTQLAETV